MEVVMEFMETIFEWVVRWGMFFFEVAGVSILIFTGVRAVIHLVRQRRFVRLYLAQGIALALEFKLGGEVLRTVIAREWNELGILGAVILLRGAITFLIHWEIRHLEEQEQEVAHADAEALAKDEAAERQQRLGSGSGKK